MGRRFRVIIRAFLAFFISLFGLITLLFLFPNLVLNSFVLESTLQALSISSDLSGWSARTTGSLTQRSLKIRLKDGEFGIGTSDKEWTRIHVSEINLHLNYRLESLWNKKALPSVRLEIFELQSKVVDLERLQFFIKNKDSLNLRKSSPLQNIFLKQDSCSFYPQPTLIHLVEVKITNAEPSLARLSFEERLSRESILRVFGFPQVSSNEGLQLSLSWAAQDPHLLGESSGKATIDFQNEKASLKWSGRFVPTVGEIQEIYWDACPMTYRQVDKVGLLSPNSKKIESSCLFHVRLNPERVFKDFKPKRIDFDSAPLDVSLILETDLEASYPGFTSSSKLAGKSQLKVVDYPRFLKDLFDFDFSLFAKIDGKIEDLTLGKGVRVLFDSQVLIPRFSSLLNSEVFLNLSRGSGFFVPAPLHVLDGDIGAQVRGVVFPELGPFEFDLQSKLENEPQALFLEAKAKLNPEVSMNRGRAEIEVRTSKVRLMLPPTLSAPPKSLVDDPRIQKNKIEKTIKDKHDEEKPSPWKIILSFSSEEHPIELLNDFSEEPLKVYSDLLSEDGVLSGRVRLDKSKLSLFNRNVELERFGIEFLEPIEESIVNGKLKADFADYTVYVTIRDQISSPTVVFYSEPPLPKDQVLAVLLFGAPIEELDPDFQADVSSVQSSIEKKSMSLASLFLLGATPIESVGYDSHSKRARVRANLGGRTSLHVESGFSDSKVKVGLSRRLGKNFRVSTELYPSDDSNERNLFSSLEWFISF